MRGKRSNPDYLNGIPELLILKLLSRQPMHGYELVRTISVLSGGELEFGEGCIYPLLHRLEAEGALRSHQQQREGRRRVVYSLSAAGQRRLARTKARWLQVVEAIGRVLGGEAHGHARMA